ncbi:MAG: cytochrome P450, partial [Cyanobacteria bacterium P01_F01_bin.42]
FSLATAGQVFPDDAFQQFCEMCVVGTARMTRSSLSNALIPTNPFGRKYRAVSRKWFNRFSQVTADAFENPDQTSLLGWVVQRGGTDFKPEQIRNFLAGVYPGGAISAPSGTTSALHLLWQNPQILPSLLDELRELFSAPLTLERLDKSLVLDQVIREALRLRPPVAFFTRNVGRDDVYLGDRKIPANTSIFINSWYLHRHPQHWLEPERFNPNRWDAETREQNPYGSGYFFPFGRGNRSCIGQTFARIFMKLSLAVLLHERQITFGPEPATPEFYFAVSVPRQLRMTLTPRSQ